MTDVLENTGGLFPAPEDTPLGITTQIAPVEPTEKPGFLDAVGPAFKTENTVGSFVQFVKKQGELGKHATIEETYYNPFDEISGTQYEEYAKAFVGIQSAEQADIIKKYIDEEIAAKEIIMDAGGDGFLAMLAAGIIDPINLIPVAGSAGRSIKAGETIASASARGARAGLVGAAYAEAVLNPTQETRTLNQSFLNVLGGLAFGAALGSGAGAVNKYRRTPGELSAEIWNSPKFDGVDISDNIIDSMMGDGLSAEAAAKIDPDLLGPKTSFGAGEALSFSGPMQRVLFQSTSANAIRTVQKLGESAYIFKMNKHGIPAAPGGTVETAGKMALGDVFDIERQAVDIFTKMRTGKVQGTIGRAKLALRDTLDRSNNDMNVKEFFGEVARALRKGDHKVKEVQEAATLYRSFIDKLATEASKEDLININSIGRQQEDGEFYFPIVWRTGDIVKSRTLADGTGFEDLLAKHFKDGAAQSQEQLTKNIDEINRLTAAKQALVADLPDADILNRVRRSAGVQRGPKYPVIGLLREYGGVQPGSPLGKELGAMGVTSKTHPGLYRKGGLEDVDNLPISEHPLFEGFEASAERGYIAPSDILDAISEELAGNPLRIRTEETDFQDYIDNIAQYLEENNINYRVMTNEQIINELINSQGTINSFNAKRPVKPVDVEGTPIKLDDLEKMSGPGHSSPGFTARDAERLKQLEDGLEILSKMAEASDEAVARDLAREATDHVLGASAADLARPYGSGKRGPMIERMLNAPSHIKDRFSEQNALNVLRHYTRVVSTDTAMVRTFGDLDLEIQIQKIRDDFAIRRHKITMATIDKFLSPKKGFGDLSVRDYIKKKLPGISDDDMKALMSRDLELLRLSENPAIIKMLEDTPEQQKARTKLHKKEDATIKDIQDMRDIIRGEFDVPDDPHAWINKFEKNLLTWNYISMLGGMTISAIPDIAMGVFRNGLVRQTSTIAKLTAGSADLKATTSEMRAMGVGYDMARDTRLAAMTETSPGQFGQSTLDTAFNTGAKAFGIATLMTPWNAAMKQINGVVFGSYVVSSARKLARVKKKVGGDPIKLMQQLQAKQANLKVKGLDLDAGELEKLATIKKAQKTIEELARWNISPEMAERILKQVDQYSPDYKNTLMFNVRYWADGDAANTLRQALVTQVDKTIITPGLEKPLWMSKRGWRHFGQFKSFATASTQMILVSGLQQADARTLNGIILLVALGGVSYGIKERRAGREIPDDKSVILKNAIDRSGITGFLFDVNNILEKLPGENIGISHWMGQDTTARYKSRNIVGALAGPTGNTIANSTTIFGHAAGGDWSASDSKKLRRMIPFQNAIGFKRVFDEFESGLNSALGVED